MKNLLVTTLILLATSYSHAGWFNDSIEDVIKKQGGVVFNEPKFDHGHILANSPSEREMLTSKAQHNLQVIRLTNFCLSLGFNTPVLGTTTDNDFEHSFIDYAYDQNGTGVRHENEFRPYSLYFTKIGCINKTK